MSALKNFFALIKTASGGNEIRRIRVNQSLQKELMCIFENQKFVFERGVDTEIEFNGDWKPDSNELLVIKNIAESEMIVNSLKRNVSSFNDIDLSKFKEEPIKAIFTGSVSGGVVTALIQKFSTRQALSLYELPIIKMQKGNTFIKTTDDIFTIDNKLVAVIEGNKTKFKSFHNARMVFNLSDHYREATDEDLTEISQHQSLDVADVNSFITNADTPIRKMAHSIKSSGVLDNYTVKQIASAAKKFAGISVSVKNGKISFPEDKKELKEVLHFLLEEIYKGPLSGNDYLTNSKRIR